MANRFVDLQAQLAATQDQRAGLFRTLRRIMQGYCLFGDTGGVLQQVQRFHQLIAAQNVLPAETVRVGALLDSVALEASRGDTATGSDAPLVNFGTAAGGEPRINLAKLQIGFRQRDTL